MNKIKKISLLISVFCIIISLTACKEDSADLSSFQPLTETTAEITTETTTTTTAPPQIREPDISGQTIYWLADYDLNPQEGENRSTALSLFEDVYSAHIEYIHADEDKKFDVLDERLLSGDPVDMFPYEINAVPEGVIKNRFQPLDDYFDVLGWDTDLWSDMHDTADIFAYNGQHYVVPYSISDPFVIIYSRKLMKSEGFDDPYQLYKKDKWDWDTFLNMMNTFVSKQIDGTTRYGIAGQFGEACLYSAGTTIVSLENGKLVNNINNSNIEKAENLLLNINKSGLYNSSWYLNFPTNMNTLFYGMHEWALRESNALTPDYDLMAVPFPKSPDSDEYYITASYNAKMLVKGSDKGEAVATYIKCERLVETSEKYQEAEKSQAVQKVTTPKGIVTSYLTEEQYDALQEYTNPSKLTPIFDFGYGMGDTMYGEGSYNFETRGVMNKLAYEFIEDKGNADDWSELREICSQTIDEEIKKLK